MAAPLSRTLRRQLTWASSPAASRFVTSRAATAKMASSPFRAQRLFSASAKTYSANETPASPPPPPPPPPPHGPKQAIKFWPFLVVIALGSGGYVLLVNQRKKMSDEQKEQKEQKPAPAYSADDVTVVFVLGGPGAGKGTQCARLVQTYGFAHLSAGDLLRAEQDRPGSEFGQLIKDYIRDGLIVPMEVTVKLLENAMRDTMARDPAKKRFLIDGFPRKMDQAVAFEEAVCPARIVLFYDCPESEMERRLLERGKTSGRTDDNADSIRKRFRTFVETSMPVVDAYEAGGKVIKIDATRTPDAVFQDTQAKLSAHLAL